MASSFPSTEEHLGAAITGPLSREKINLTFLTHVAGSPERFSTTVFCTNPAQGTDSFTQIKSRLSEPRPILFAAGSTLISLFPHDKRPEIAGYFLHSLAQAGVIILGVASSPSAITAIISLKARAKAVEALFEHFQFPAYDSPAEFYAIQQPPEKLVREVVASYQEKAPKIYVLHQDPGLDLWEISIPSVTAVAAFSRAFQALGDKGLKAPFLVASPRLRKKELLFCFALASEGRARAQEVFAAQLPDITVDQPLEVAAFFTHGPHFGDRYGIAHILVNALEMAKIPLLALSCTVNSISAICRREDLTNAVRVLGETFEAPVASSS